MAFAFCPILSRSSSSVGQRLDQPLGDWRTVHSSPVIAKPERTERMTADNYPLLSLIVIPGLNPCLVCNLFQLNSRSVINQIINSFYAATVAGHFNSVLIRFFVVVIFMILVDASC